VKSPNRSRGRQRPNLKSPFLDDKVDDRIVALLDQIGGDGEAHGILARLLDRGEPPAQIAGSIAGSAPFGRLYKMAHTLAIGVEGAKDPEPVFVGLPELTSGLPFEEQFQQHFRPFLGKRADGFEAIFGALLAPRRNLLIIETGSMRVPTNWEGDGQSTFMFDALVRCRGGLLFSIDVSLESLETARRACSSMTQLILNDSVAALHALDRSIARPADLLYLDSFDLDPSAPLPSAIHHALELTAARSLVGSGTIVSVDDYAIGSQGGKGMILDKFFSNIRAEVIYSGYQKVWRVP
jgi:hypothetical protein